MPNLLGSLMKLTTSRLEPKGSRATLPPSTFWGSFYEFISMQNTSLPAQKSQLRKQIIQQRNALSSNEQNVASNAILSHLKSLKKSLDLTNVAFYFSFAGEINTQPLIEWFWQQGANVYLPVLHPFSKGELLFLKYTKESILLPNKYGIKEPKLNCLDVLPTSHLTTIFTPLVAFDAKGHRLGMGGGYYDRTLASSIQSNSPAIMGIAHSLQYVSHIPTEPWDISLSTVITPNKIWYCN